MIKDTNKTLNDLVLERMQTVYNGKPWYGKSFNQLIQEVDLKNNEVQKLLLHIIAWREYVIDLLGGGRPSIEMDSNEDWPQEQLSRNEIELKLQNTELLLIKTIKAFDPSNWHDLVWHEDYTYYYLTNGIIDHDIYHIGQIILHHKKNI